MEFLCFVLDGAVDLLFCCYFFWLIVPLYKYSVSSKWVSGYGQNRVMHAVDNIAKTLFVPTLHL